MPNHCPQYLTPEERDDLIGHALRYHDMGWSVFPVGGQDPDDPRRCKRPAYPWSKVTKRRMPTNLIQKLFDRPHVTGIGVVMGRVSGGLAARDFDSDESHAVWSGTQPALARVTPMSIGGVRGGHRWLYAPDEQFEMYEHPAQKGEYRGTSGCIMIAPPSLHPSGRKYRWLIPPWNWQMPHLDPAADGLWPAPLRLLPPAPETGELSPANAQGTHTHSDRLSYGHPGSSSECQMETEVEDGRYDLLEPCCLTRLDTMTDDILSAVQRYIPVEYGTRNVRLYWLSRWLRTNYPNILVGDWEPVVRHWHQLSLPTIRTQDWGESWSDFSRLIGKAKTRRDDHYLDRFLNPLVHKIDRLRLYCQFLAKAPGNCGGVFYLSKRHAGEILGVSPTAAMNWIERAIKAGWLVVHKRGVPHPTDRTRTTQYRLAER